MSAFYPPVKLGGIEFLLGSNRGVYIPRDFIESYREEIYGDLSKYKTDLASPDLENYWEAWTELCAEVEVEDVSGKVWQLYQDGDLFLVCDAYMDDEEYKSFYGEERH